MMKTLVSTMVVAVGLVGAVASASADVRRNAGISSHGGMGLDVDWYCKQVYGRASVSVNVDDTAYGWRCTKGNQLVGISMDAACKAHYGNTATAKRANRSAGAWHCILGLNLTWYCQQKHGQSARAQRLFDSPYSWKCVISGNYLAISMSDACKSHYGSSASPVLGWYGDEDAWHCVIR